MSTVNTQPGARRPVWIGVAAGGAAVGLSVYHLVYSAWAAGAHGFADFHIFLDSARAFLDTGVLYPDVHDAEKYAPAAPVYKFPPLFALILVGVVRNGIPPGAFFGHWVVQLVLYAGAVLAMLQALKGRSFAVFAFLGLIAAANFEPFFETLYRLQLETPVLLLLALCLLFLKQERDAAAGAAIGVAAMLKIYPAFLLLYFLVRRRWRVLAGCLAAAVLLQVASLIVIGFEQNRVFFFELLPVLLGQAPAVNPEAAGLANALRSHWEVGALAATWISRPVSLALAGASIWMVARSPRSERSEERTALELALFVCLILLIMPNAWVNYQLLLLLPLFVALRGYLDSAARPVAVPVLLGASYLLMLFYAPCAELSRNWPCAQTPLFLGLFRFPRTLHDLFVGLRWLAALFPWLAAMLLLDGMRRGQPRGIERSR